jgi:hypothetical protein
VPFVITDSSFRILLVSSVSGAHVARSTISLVMPYAVCRCRLQNILAISVKELSYSNPPSTLVETRRRSERRNYPIPYAWLGDAPSN